MKLLSEPDSGSPYLHATAAHVEASAAALRVITERVTAATVRAGARPLYVRLAHLEHGAFLTTQLFGSNVLPYTGTTVPGRDAGAASRPAAALLREPFSATEEEPFTYAVVANHPVAVQVETALTALAGLLARQELVDRLRNEDHTHVDARAAQADAQAHRTVQDAIRSRSWPAAAEALRERAIAAGRPLVVRYDSVVLDEEAVRRRVPVLRHVYNAMPEAREAIDKVATVLSQTMRSIGGGTREIGASTRQLLDVGAHRTYFAHLARDAFVCGNGYLSFGTARDEDLRLLRPEHTRMDGPERAVVVEGERAVVHAPVLHLTGARQVGSSFGISVLEPFVLLLIQRQNFELSLALERDALAHPDAAAAAMAGIRSSAEFARRMLPAIAEQAASLLGGPNALAVEVPTDLYFRGHVDMAPAAEALTLDPREWPA